MQRLSATALVLVSISAAVILCGLGQCAVLSPRPGTGMFLMLSDVHFDPYADPAIIRQLGAEPLPACQAPASGEFSKFGSDSNYPLLKSTLDEAVATARQNHIHYDYVIVTGDLLAHNFDTRYQRCVGGAPEAYGKFASDTVRFVDAMMIQAFPGVPIFATLGNNDTDHGDYVDASREFLAAVGQDWGRTWSNVSAGRRQAALDSFARAGNYALPQPNVPNNELIVINTNLWVARKTQACSEADPDPAGQFHWLEGVLDKSRRAGRSASLIMHVLPGIDAMKSSGGTPRAFWTDSCTRKFIDLLTDFRGVVREMYAGHIHRDDFRLLPDRDGKPLSAIHIAPAVSPVYFDNPAVEIGWYDKSGGALRDYATLALDLGSAKPAWRLEYLFSQAYGHSRADLATMEELSWQIRNPRSGASRKYADYYGAGVNVFLTPDNWSNYACAQTEITPAAFAQCRDAGAGQ